MWVVGRRRPGARRNNSPTFMPYETLLLLLLLRRTNAVVAAAPALAAAIAAACVGDGRPFAILVRRSLLDWRATRRLRGVRVLCFLRVRGGALGWRLFGGARGCLGVFLNRESRRR